VNIVYISVIYAKWRAPNLPENCDMLPTAPARVSIGTAGRGGVFFPLGIAMAAVISKYVSGVESVAEATGGGAKNMKLLQDGKIGLALATADVAWGAMHGKLNGLRDNFPVRTLLTRHTCIW
jgi:uncharacterized protein